MDLNGRQHGRLCCTVNHLPVAPRMICMLRLTQSNAAMWQYFVGTIVMYIYRDMASNVLLRAMVDINGCINDCL